MSTKKKAIKPKKVLVKCDNCHGKFSEHQTNKIRNITVCDNCYSLLVDWANDICGTDYY